MMTSKLRSLALLVAALLAADVAACRPEDQRTETIDPGGAQTRAQLPLNVVAQLDSGTMAYRAEDLEAALGHYTRATELAPDVAAGWFGVYMVQHQIGDTVAAAEALERAQGLAPGASLIHPTAADTIR